MILLCASISDLNSLRTCFSSSSCLFKAFIFASASALVVSLTFFLLSLFSSSAILALIPSVLPKDDPINVPLSFVRVVPMSLSLCSLNAVDCSRFCISATEAGLFVNKNYFTIEKWWNSKKVQDIRREFCNMYCRHFEPKKDLINLLKI